MNNRPNKGNYSKLHQHKKTKYNSEDEEQEGPQGLPSNQPKRPSSNQLSQQPSRPLKKQKVNNPNQPREVNMDYKTLFQAGPKKGCVPLLGRSRNVTIPQFIV